MPTTKTSMPTVAQRACDFWWCYACRRARRARSRISTAPPTATPMRWHAKPPTRSHQTSNAAPTRYKSSARADGPSRRWRRRRAAPKRQDSPTSPMPLAAIPGVQQIGKAVVCDACDWPDRRQSDDPRQPRVARRESPDGDGAIGPYVQVPIGIEPMQAEHIFQLSAEAGERIRLEIDVAEFDDAGARGLHQAI